MFGSFQAAVTAARRHGDLYFAALLDRESITEAFGSTISAWQGWLYTPAKAAPKRIRPDDEAARGIQKTNGKMTY